MTGLEGMTPDADGKYRFEIRLGTVEYPQPTGYYIALDDGSIALEMTDYVDRDQYGVEVERRPAESIVRMTHEDFQPLPGQRFTQWELFAALERTKPKPVIGGSLRDIARYIAKVFQ